MGDTRDPWIEHLIDGLVPPQEVTNRIISVAGTIFLAVILLALSIVSLPPVRHWLDCRFDLVAKTSEDRELVKNWCDFFIITLQTIIFVCVGGIAFAESSAAKFKAFVIAYVERRELELPGAGARIRGELVTNVHAIVGLATDATIWTFPRRLVNLFRYTLNIISVFRHDFPYHVATFIGLRFMKFWPGGVIGFISFFLFVPWTLAQVIKTYNDYSSCVVIP